MQLCARSKYIFGQQHPYIALSHIHINKEEKSEKFDQWVGKV